MYEIASALINWYEKNKRDLPWRNTNDPYLIWLSEIILQQTRVDQGMSYYLRFAAKYPDIKKLAAASEDEVMKLWQGLGYYSRARNLHHTAKAISSNYKGQFPKNYHEIRQLKGIGDYTAAAIASFAFNKPHAVVDGNVYRVLSRIFGIKTPINNGKGKKQFYDLANSLIDPKRPALFNQAIMEFGALHCKPATPGCHNCIFNHNCFAFEKKQVNRLPVKEKKNNIQHRYFYYLVIRNQEKLLLKKREAKDIWQNLYEFPLVETPKKISEKQLMGSKEWKKLTNNKKHLIRSISAEYKHVLSHRMIHARFFEIMQQMPKAKGYQLASISKIHDYPVSQLINKYLESKEKEWF